MHPAWILITAGASVALLPTILPDHWMPTAIVARSERWSPARTTRVSAWTAVGHFIGSILLGLVVIAVGTPVSGVMRGESHMVGVVLIATGVAYGGWGWWNRHRRAPAPEQAHNHHHHHEHRDHAGERRSRMGAILIPLGIAASSEYYDFASVFGGSGGGSNAFYRSAGDLCSGHLGSHGGPHGEIHLRGIPSGMALA